MNQPGNAMKRLLTFLGSGTPEPKAVSSLFSQDIRGAVEGKETAALEEFKAGFNTGRLKAGGSEIPFDVVLDLSLAAGCHFVVMSFNRQAALQHRLHHFAAEVHPLIGRRAGKIAFLLAQLVPAIG